MGALELHRALQRSAYAPGMDVNLERGAWNVLWGTMAQAAPGECQNFSLPLLTGLQALIESIGQNGGRWSGGGEMVGVDYMVLACAHPNYFSLGGDLEHFRACIARRDREGLHRYSRLCLDIVYAWATHLNQHTTTIALVQGRALGGGFEAALSADYLIAEEQSEFGFPEILFGLFPCTGGMSLLARRIGVYRAERMMSDARIYSARELKEIGVVDEVCPRGEGRLTVERFVAAHGKHRNARLALQRARRRCVPLDYAELLTVVEEWVDAAMNLADEDLKVMDMLVKLQRPQMDALSR